MSQLDLPNFLSCPLEILWKIFLELVPDAQAIRTCRLVCRTFLQGIDSSLQLRIFLKCDAWGYRQPSFRKDGRSLNLSEFSEKLDAHVRSWGDLDWQESHVRIPSPGAAYALSQGVFASVSFHSELSSVTCVTLPSRIMGTEAAVHTLDDVGFPVKDLVIDPSQDLLILLELQEIDPATWGSSEARLHILRLSDGLKHPTAKLTLLETNYFVDPDATSQLHISGSRVGFMWREEHRDSVLQVWDWEGGDLLWSRVLPEEVTTYYFIAPNTVLVPTMLNRQVYLETWTISGPPKTSVGVVVNTFAFPKLTNLRESQAVLWGEASPPIQNGAFAARCPFESSLDRRMMKIEWETQEVHSNISDDAADGMVQFGKYEIFAPVRAFTGDYEGYNPMEPIPYFVWSSGMVHVSQDAPKFNVLELYNCSGRHACMLSPSIVEIRDFVVPRHHGTFPDNGLTTRELVQVSKPSIEQLSTSNSQSDDFRSYSLSYWKFTRNLGFEVRGELEVGVIIDEEHIILPQIESFDADCDLIILTM